MMSPEEFTALSKPDALAHLNSLKRAGAWTDYDRLTGAWWKTKAERIDADEAEVSTSLDLSAEPAVAMSRNSVMLGAGRVITGIGIVGALLCGFIASSRLGDGDAGALPLMIWSYLFGSVASLGALFWIAGALEQRLIQVIDRLPEKTTT